MSHDPAIILNPAQREFPRFSISRLLSTVFKPTKGCRICILTDFDDPGALMPRFAFLGQDEYPVQQKAHEQRRRVCPLGEANARHVEFRPVVRLDADPVRLEARWQRRLVLLHLILLVYRDPTSGS